MKKIRIAMIGTKGVPAKWGGIEKYIEEVGKRLVERGHEVTVFGSRWFLREYRQDTYKGIRVRRVPVIHLQATDALSNAFFAAMRIAAGGYDIVNFHGYASYLFIPLIARAGKITVVTAHGVESGWANPKYGPLARGVIKQAFKMGITQADCVTTVAEHLKEKMEHDFKVDALVLPSGIDQATPSPPALIEERYNLHGGDYLLFLGRIDTIKRIDWVLDLRNLLPNNLRLVIAGGAQDTSTMAYLQSLKRKTAGDPRVTFTGPVFGQEKTELLSNCLVFLAPSMDEGLPITVLEAMSYGRCCIASDIPAHREVIQDGATELLFPRNDNDAFLKKVKAAIGNPKGFLESIGLEAQRKAEAKFNWDKTADRTENLYQKLLNDRAVQK